MLHFTNVVPNNSYWFYWDFTGILYNVPGDNKSNNFALDVEAHNYYFWGKPRMPADCKFSRICTSTYFMGRRLLYDRHCWKIYYGKICFCYFMGTYQTNSKQCIMLFCLPHIPHKKLNRIYRRHNSCIFNNKNKKLSSYLINIKMKCSQNCVKYLEVLIFGDKAGSQFHNLWRYCGAIDHEYTFGFGKIDLNAIFHMLQIFVWY